MRQGGSRGLREQHGEYGGDALAASGSSFEQEFTISWAGVARRPMPRRRGRLFSSKNTSASTKEGALDCGWGPSSRSPSRAMERCNPAILAAVKTAGVINELLFWSLGMGGTRWPTNVFDKKATSPSASWSIGPQMCCLWATSFARGPINCSSEKHLVDKISRVIGDAR